MRIRVVVVPRELLGELDAIKKAAGFPKSTRYLGTIHVWNQPNTVALHFMDESFEEVQFCEVVGHLTLSRDKIEVQL